MYTGGVFNCYGSEGPHYSSYVLHMFLSNLADTSTQHLHAFTLNTKINDVWYVRQFILHLPGLIYEHVGYQGYGGNDYPYTGGGGGSGAGWMTGTQGGSQASPGSASKVYGVVRCVGLDQVLMNILNAGEELYTHPATGDNKTATGGPAGSA